MRQLDRNYRLCWAESHEPRFQGVINKFGAMTRMEELARTLVMFGAMTVGIEDLARTLAKFELKRQEWKRNLWY